MPEIEEILEKFNKEIEIAKTTKFVIKGCTEEEVITYNKMKQEVIADLEVFIKDYLTKYNDIKHLTTFSIILNEYLSGGLLSPLRLDEDEFEPIGYGFYENKRYPAIKKDFGHLYNENAYNLIVKEVYDSLTGQLVEIDEFHGEEFNMDPSRCYIIKGGRFTPYYFNRARIILKDSELNYYTPCPFTIKIPCIAILYKDKYIICCKTNNKGFTKLSRLYKIDLIKDENTELDKFGINYEFT